MQVTCTDPTKHHLIPELTDSVLTANGVDEDGQELAIFAVAAVLGVTT